MQQASTRFLRHALWLSALGIGTLSGPAGATTFSFDAGTTLTISSNVLKLKDNTSNITIRLTAPSGTWVDGSPGTPYTVNGSTGHYGIIEALSAGAVVTLDVDTNNDGTFGDAFTLASLKFTDPSMVGGNYTFKPNGSATNQEFNDPGSMIEAATYTPGTASNFTGITSLGIKLATSATGLIVDDIDVSPFALTAPGAPTIGTATAGSGSISVAFTAPGSNGGAAITGYSASCTSSDGGTSGSNTGGSSPISVSGLTNGKTYTCTVTATNSVGTGSASAASGSAIPKAGQTISFTGPANQNFGASPTLSASSDSGLTVAFTSATSGVCTVSGTTVTLVSTGTCTINANQAGNGTYSAAPQVAQSFTVNAVTPGAPTIGAATAGNTQASVTFTAPASTGGDNISGYTVTASPGGLTGTGTSSPIIVTGLTNGTTYTFTVTATNTAGTGSASAASNSITPAASQTISFTGPANQNFGASPTLSATSTSGLTVAFTSATTSVCTVAGTTVTLVTPGTCTINANQAGDGTYLAAAQVQQSFTVAAVAPGVPTGVSASGGDNSASVSFTTPASNGGDTITSYTASCTSSDMGAPGSNTGSSSPISITGLTNGKTYTCVVKATNGIGTGSDSAPSSSFSPAAGPAVSSVAVPANGRYKAGSSLDFTVTWDNAVTVTGTPRFPLTIGSTTRYATYQSGSGTTATVFRHTVQAGDTDTDGITVGGTIDLNSGTLQDGSSRNATLILNSVGSTTNVLVDTTAPTLPTANVVVNNQADPHQVILTFSENLDGTSLGAAGNWTVTDNGGSTTYSVASVGLSSNKIVTLTLNAVDLSGSTTAITNAAANAHLKVTPPATLKDVAGNTYAAGLVTEAGATHVLDVTAPTLSGVASSSPSATGGTLTATASEKAKGYWIAVASGATAPTVAEVKAGSNYGAVTVVAHGSGILPSGTAGSLTLAGLTASTAYDLYLMAEDAAGNPVGGVETTTLTTTAVPVVSGGGATTPTTPTTPNPFNPAGNSTATTVNTNVGSSLGGGTVVTPATGSIISNLPEVNQTTGVSDNGVVVVIAPPGKTIKLVDNAPDGVLFSLPVQQAVPVQLQGKTIEIVVNNEVVKDIHGKPLTAVLATRTVTDAQGNRQQVLEVISGQGQFKASTANQTIGSLTLSQGGTLRTVTIVDNAGNGGGTTVPGTAGFFKDPGDKSGAVSAENGAIVLRVVLTPDSGKNTLAADLEETRLITLQAGEVARFNAKGELIGVFAGSLSGTLGKTGDPLTTLVPPSGLDKYPSRVLKLDGNTLDRLGTNLLPGFASVISNTGNFAADEAAASATLRQEAATGIVTATSPLRPDLSYFGLPVGDVTINPEVADGIVWHTNGTVTWTLKGVSVTFAPVSGSLGELAASARQMGYSTQVLDNGAFKLSGAGTYLVGQPRFHAQQLGQPAGLAWDHQQQRAYFADSHGHTQYIDPVPYDGSQLDAAVANLPGWKLERDYFLYGGVRLSGPDAQKMVLVPEYSVTLERSEPGTSYSGSDGRFFFHYKTGFLPFTQPFLIK